jgi:hypothetical protein
LRSHASRARFRDAAVECRCGNGVDDQTFVIAVELLRAAPLPAVLRAAVLRAMALVPGIEQRTERDVLGRRAGRRRGCHGGERQAPSVVSRRWLASSPAVCTRGVCPLRSVVPRSADKPPLTRHLDRAMMIEKGQ